MTVSGQRFIPLDIAQVFPVARGVFRMFNAPANYIETVNSPMLRATRQMGQQLPGRYQQHARAQARHAGAYCPPKG